MDPDNRYPDKKTLTNVAAPSSPTSSAVLILLECIDLIKSRSLPQNHCCSLCDCFGDKGRTVQCTMYGPYIMIIVFVVSTIVLNASEMSLVIGLYTVQCACIPYSCTCITWFVKFGTR